MTAWLHQTTVTQRIAVAVIGLSTLCAWLAIPDVNHPVGSDWAQYFTVADIIWNQDPHLYPPFRKPMYGLILGGAGEGLGYLNAAQLIGRLSACLIVVSAGIGGWALVGPLAGASAAVFAVMMPLILDGGAACPWPGLGE